MKPNDLILTFLLLSVKGFYDQMSDECLSVFEAGTYFYRRLKKDCVIFEFHNFWFAADQNARFSLLTCLRLRQFSNTEKVNFPGNKLMSFNEIRNFHTPR